MEIDILFYEPGDQPFVDAYSLDDDFRMHRIFEQLLAPGVTDWDLLVSGDFSDSDPRSPNNDDLIGYNASTQTASVLSTYDFREGGGAIRSVGVDLGGAWNGPWTHMEIGDFIEHDDVLLYDAPTGKLMLIENRTIEGTSQRGVFIARKAQTFPVGLTHIVPIRRRIVGRLNESLMGLFALGPSPTIAGRSVGRLYRIDDGKFISTDPPIELKLRTFEQRFTHAMSVGPWDAGLLLYSASSGRANFYTIDSTGDLSLVRATKWTTGWKLLVSLKGPYRGYLLFYRGSTHEGKVYALDDLDFRMRLIREYAGWKSRWSHIFSGDFQNDAPEPDEEPDEDPNEEQGPCDVMLMVRFPATGHAPTQNSEQLLRYTGKLVAASGDVSVPEGADQFDQSRTMTWFAGMDEFVHLIQIADLKLGKWSVTITGAAGGGLAHCDNVILNWHGSPLDGSFKFTANKVGCARGFEPWP